MAAPCLSGFAGPMISGFGGRSVAHLEHFVHPGAQTQQQFAVVAENVLVSIDSHIASAVLGEQHREMWQPGSAAACGFGGATSVSSGGRPCRSDSNCTLPYPSIKQWWTISTGADRSPLSPSIDVAIHGGLGSVQLDSVQPLRGVEQITHGSGLGQRDSGQVIVGAEVVADPHRRADPKGGLDDMLAESREAGQALDMQTSDIAPGWGVVEDLQYCAVRGVLGVATGSPHSGVKLPHFAGATPLGLPGRFIHRCPFPQTRTWATPKRTETSK